MSCSLRSRNSRSPRWITWRTPDGPLAVKNSSPSLIPPIWPRSREANCAAFSGSVISRAMKKGGFIRMTSMPVTYSRSFRGPHAGRAHGCHAPRIGPPNVSRSRAGQRGELGACRLHLARLGCCLIAPQFADLPAQNVGVVLQVAGPLPPVPVMNPMHEHAGDEPKDEHDIDHAAQGQVEGRQERPEIDRDRAGIL